MATLATAIIAAAIGAEVGFALASALAIQIAADWLDQYALRMNGAADAALLQARNLLTAIKASPYPFCSDSEIGYIREHLYDAEYLRDAGRIRNGKIQCSAAEGRLPASVKSFVPDSYEPDGTMVYTQLAPFASSGPRRVSIQSGDAYVTGGVQIPEPMGPVPMQIAMTFKGNPGAQFFRFDSQMLVPNHPALVTDARISKDGTLYATRCSTIYFDCITAYTTVAEALHGERIKVIQGSTIGGLTGLLLGIGFSLVYRRSQSTAKQLQRAIRKDKIAVAYQPIVELPAGRIVGAEALARWTDEEGFAVSPVVFIRIAEERGFVGEITERVLGQSLRDFKETLRSRPEFRLSVNVAAADLADPSFMPMLEDALKRAGVEARSLAIEITERSTVHSTAIETIVALRSKGYSVQIDDFGTGYSSLSYLHAMRCDAIKIDRSFTQAIGTDSVTVGILPQILSIANTLSLQVIVEGIETSEQAAYFAAVDGPIFAQGLLYGCAVPADEFHLRLAEQPAADQPATDQPLRHSVA